MVSGGFGGRVRMIAHGRFGVAVSMVAWPDVARRSSPTCRIPTTRRTSRCPRGWSEADAKPSTTTSPGHCSTSNRTPPPAARLRPDLLVGRVRRGRGADRPSHGDLRIRRPSRWPTRWSCTCREPLRGPGVVRLPARHLPPGDRVRRAAYDQAGGIRADAGFELLQDEVLTPADGHPRRPGRLQLPSYASGVVHTFDLTAYANNDSSILYLLLIRCTATLLPGTRGRAQRRSPRRSP